MLDELIENNCIKYGSFQLKSNEISKYYFDMKSIVSYPALLKKIGDEIYEKIDKECDLLCGVPLGGLPVCSYISAQYEIPMIMVRDEVKSYGTNRQIEGNYHKKNKCIIIEDVITTGGSSIEAVKRIRDVGYKVNRVVSIIDRQENGEADAAMKWADLELVSIYKLEELF